VNIFVGNLPYSMSDEELRAVFEEYGSVRDARVVMDRYTGRSRGFGFVEMDANNEAQTAIEALSGTEVGGRPLTVNEARPKNERGPRRDSGGGGQRDW
jgi:RNA recognition motif-containing protein